MSVIFATDVFSVISSYFTRLFSCIGYSLGDFISTNYIPIEVYV